MNLVVNCLAKAKKIISPAWPLHSFVASNPFWNLKNENFYRTLIQMSQLNQDKQLFMPLSYYSEKYSQGEISESDLVSALEYTKHLGIDFQDVQVFIRESMEEREGHTGFKTYSEFLDQKLGLNTNDFILQEITKYCASYFDLGQSPFHLQSSQKRLYDVWKDFIIYDKNLQTSPYCKQEIKENMLGHDPVAMLEICYEKLSLNLKDDLTPYLKKICLLTKGWCSHIAYQAWQEGLSLTQIRRGTEIEDLLAIYMAYEVFLKEEFSDVNAQWINFHKKQSILFSKELEKIDHIFQLIIVWQRALEYSYQKKLAHLLTKHENSAQEIHTDCQVQMVFCIDVRSEIIRRHIEHTLPYVQTAGFAGFFGMALHCNHPLENSPSYRCPVLLKPKINVQEKFSKKLSNKVLGLQSLLRFKNGLKQGFTSSFFYVEFFGALSLFKILKQLVSNKNQIHKIIEQKFLTASQFESSLSLKEKTELALFALTHLGIKQFAKTVIICGHASVSTNNAFSASLQCGACGGHGGDVNARFICQLLNDREVRIEFEKSGVIKIPNETYFLPAVHETVSDKIFLLDRHLIPNDRHSFLQELEKSFFVAAELSEKERFANFHNSKETTSPTSSERSTNWAEVRPEWALANNASFIVAPRDRTKNLNLAGRAFLHDYHYQQDKEFKTLELILTAPMIVTNWINLQYYASSVALHEYSAGNKTLHNPVGLFGVLEGNSSDLKIGLPMQSVHNGERLMHEPLRLSVFVEAPKEEIEKIVFNHQVVKDLVQQEWLFLFCLDPISKQIYLRSQAGEYKLFL